MPQLGETVTEGTITKWLKQVGDQVAVDEPLFEVSTDKVDSEVPSPVAGVLTEIVVPEGDTVEVGVRLAVVGDGDGAPRRAAPPSRRAGARARRRAGAEPPAAAPAPAPGASAPPRHRHLPRAGAGARAAPPRARSGTGAPRRRRPGGSRRRSCGA